MGVKNKLYTKVEKQLNKLLKPQIEKVLQSAWLVYQEQTDNLEKGYPFICTEEDFFQSVKCRLTELVYDAPVEEVKEND